MTLDVALDGITQVSRIVYLQSHNTLFLLDDKGQIRAVHVTELPTPSNLKSKFTFGDLAERTTTIVRFHQFTSSYTIQDDTVHIFNVNDNGKIAHSLETTNTLLLEEFSKSKILSLSDSDLLAQLKKRKKKATIQPSLLTQIVRIIYTFEKKHSDEFKYYQTLNYLFTAKQPQHIPSEQILFLLTKLLKEQSKLKEPTRLILILCQLLSKFERDAVTTLPVEVLPVLVKRFKVNETWMIEAINLVIDIHIRNIVTNPELTSLLQQFRYSVDAMRQDREQLMKVKGIMEAITSSSKTMKHTTQPSGMGIKNF
jgi:hypothetical protein